jgi:hypothetical protein
MAEVKELGEPEEPQEPEVIYRDLTKRNPTTGRPAGTIRVGSGPLPTAEELPPTNPEATETDREEKPVSPTYPTANPPRENVPMGGVKDD